MRTSIVLVTVVLATVHLSLALATAQNYVTRILFAAQAEAFRTDLAIQDCSCHDAGLLYFRAIDDVAYVFQEYELERKLDTESLHRLLELPIDQLPLANVQPFLSRCDERGVFVDLRLATQLNACNWGVDPTTRLIHRRRHELGQFKTAVNLMIRVFIARGRPKEALALLNDYAWFIHRLANGSEWLFQHEAQSFFDAMVDTIEKAQEVQNGPNIYWLLAALPEPFCDVRPMATNWNQYICTWDEDGSLGPRELVVQLQGRILGSKEVESYKDRLRAHWLKYNPDLAARVFERQELLEEELANQAKVALARDARFGSDLAQMTSFQLASLYAISRVQKAQGELLGWLNLPWLEMKDHIPAISEELENSVAELNMVITGGLLSELIQSVSDRRTQAEIMYRQICFLRTIEAIRDETAKSMVPPDALSGCRLPVPSDPITGRPFEWHVTVDGDCELFAAKVVENGYHIKAKKFSGQIVHYVDQR